MENSFGYFKAKIGTMIYLVVILQIFLPSEKICKIVVLSSIVYVSAILIVFAVFRGKHSVWIITGFGENL